MSTLSSDPHAFPVAEPAPEAGGRRILKTNTRFHRRQLALPVYLHIETKVMAAQIAEVRQAPADFPSDPPGGTWELVPTDPSLRPILISHAEYNYFRPSPGCVAIIGPYGQLTITSGTEFHAFHRRCDGEPTTLAPTDEAAAERGQKFSQLPSGVETIQLDTRTRMQMALVLLQSGTTQQKLDATRFLAHVEKNWHLLDR